MPSNQDLRDRGGKLIGRINEVAGTKLEGRDAAGRLKGTYNSKTDETRDAAGRLVGKGNQLSSVITKR
jgi:hypothetical protein